MNEHIERTMGTVEPFTIGSPLTTQIDTSPPVHVHFPEHNHSNARGFLIELACMVIEKVAHDVQEDLRDMEEENKHKKKAHNRM